MSKENGRDYFDKFAVFAMSSSTLELVTVVIPAYNSEKYIGDTVRSVLTQTYSQLELIVVDDGSVDGTAAMAEAAAHGDNRIRVFKTENKGVSAARNTGMSMANGSFIALLDADDIWYPRYLEKKINLLKENPKIGWVYSDMAAMDENGVDILPHPPAGRDDDIINNILLWEGEVVPGCGSNLLFRKELVNNGIAFNTKFSTAADQEFCIQLANCSRGKRIPERLWCYRKHAGNMSRNVALMERDHLGVYYEAEEKGLFKSKTFRNRCFANLYIILAGSWWHEGNDKTKALWWIVKAILKHPQVLAKLVNKKPWKS